MVDFPLNTPFSPAVGFECDLRSCPAGGYSKYKLKKTEMDNSINKFGIKCELHGNYSYFMLYTIKRNSFNFSVVFLLRLFGNSRSIDLWPQRLQTGQDPTVPTANESPYLRPRLHGRCYYSGCGCDSTETQALKRRQRPCLTTLTSALYGRWVKCDMNVE